VLQRVVTISIHNEVLTNGVTTGNLIF